MPRKITIGIVGEEEVGKSSIIRRYCERRFMSKYIATIGIDYGIVKTTVKDQDLRVNIFDMSGKPIFYQVRKEFYKDVHGVLMVYNIGNHKSFGALTKWFSEIMELLSDPSFRNSMVFMVCGNKCDSKREVEEMEAKHWAQLHGFLFSETSALTGQGISNMFMCLFEYIIKLRDEGIQPVEIQPKTFSKEQLEAIRCLHWAKNDYDKLGLRLGASRDEINRVYRRLAVLLHPDKSNAPGSEEAFKILVATRLALLKQLPL